MEAMAPIVLAYELRPRRRALLALVALAFAEPAAMAAASRQTAPALPITHTPCTLRLFISGIFLHFPFNQLNRQLANMIPSN